MSQLNPIRVGLLGFGVVGSGTWTVLNRNAQRTARRYHLCGQGRHGEILLPGPGTHLSPHSLRHRPQGGQLPSPGQRAYRGKNTSRFQGRQKGP